jgi:hypothetical protein
MCHTLRGEYSMRGIGKKLKTWMWLMYSLKRSKYNNLKLAEATTGRWREVGKKSGRDEPMWVAIHKYIEAMLGISLYSYLYLKLAKTLSFFIISCFQQNWRTRRWNGFCLEVSGGRPKKCIHMWVNVKMIK